MRAARISSKGWSLARREGWGGRNGEGACCTHNNRRSYSIVNNIDMYLCTERAGLRGKRGRRRRGMISGWISGCNVLNSILHVHTSVCLLQRCAHVKMQCNWMSYRYACCTAICSIIDYVSIGIRDYTQSIGDSWHQQWHMSYNHRLTCRYLPLGCHSDDDGHRWS